MIGKVRHWIARWIWVALRSETDEFLDLITGQYATQNKRLEERERAFEGRTKASEHAANRLEYDMTKAASDTTVAISDVITEIQLFRKQYNDAGEVDIAGAVLRVEKAVTKLSQRVDKLEQAATNTSKDYEVLGDYAREQEDAKKAVIIEAINKKRAKHGLADPGFTGEESKSFLEAWLADEQKPKHGTGWNWQDEPGFQRPTIESEDA